MLFCRANENLNINGNTMKMITNTRMQILHVVKQILQRERNGEEKTKKTIKLADYIISVLKHKSAHFSRTGFFCIAK